MPTTTPASPPTVQWLEGADPRTAPWHSENSTPAPRKVVVADDRMDANTAYRLACEGTDLLWRGDFHQARQLLGALGRRVDKKATIPSGLPPAEAFHQHRRARAHRARVLGRLLVLLADDHSLDLRRAPDVRQAATEAYGPPQAPRVVALSELLGVTGAHQWREKGVDVPALGDRVHPHYGVFSPVRGEYVDLVAAAPLPAPGGRAVRTAFDLGTGTGVLSALLARRGVARTVATDISPRALACARDNVHRLGLDDRVQVVGPALFPEVSALSADSRADFPEGRADLVVCNPPWLPARPTSTVEQGVYDVDGSMLHDFLHGLTAHLNPGGEGWLVLSDLAEHLGLRTRDSLLAAIGEAGLRVHDKLDTTPSHPRAKDSADPLYAARAAETTSLWRLVRA